MNVELIGVADSERRVLEKLPALVDFSANDESGKPSPDGNCRCVITENDGRLVVWDLVIKASSVMLDAD